MNRRCHLRWLRRQIRGARLPSELLFLAGALSSLLNSFTWWPIAASTLSAEEFGLVALGLTISTFSTPAMTLGVHFVILREAAMAGSTELASRLTNSFSVSISVVGSLAAVCSMLTSSWVLAVVSVTAAAAATVITLAYARGNNDVFRFASVALISQFLVPNLAFLLAFNFSQSLFLATYGLSNSLFVLFVNFRRPHTNMSSLKEMREVAKESVGYIPHLLSFLLILQGPKIAAGSLTNISNVGFAQIAAIYGGGVLTAFVAFSPVITTRILHDTSEAQFEFVAKWIAKLALLSPAVGLLAATIAASVSNDAQPTAAIAKAAFALATAYPLILAADLLAQKEVSRGRSLPVSLSSLVGVSTTFGVLLLMRGNIVVATGVACHLGLLSRFVVQYVFSIIGESWSLERKYVLLITLLSLTNIVVATR